MASMTYADCVFLNIPFDRRYEPLRRALVFTVHDCGLIARCALEVDNSGQVRAEKIYELIASCQLGIHDLSRTSLDKAHRLPRFNMPLELGVFLGAAQFGAGRQKAKSCLILDRDPDRYHDFCSDIAGQDIRSHDNQVKGLVTSVRNWLSNHLIKRDVQVPGSDTVLTRYRAFHRELPALCAELQLRRSDLLYSEHTQLVVAWLADHPWRTPAAPRVGVRRRRPR